jgi:hypothetical protein
VKATRYFEPTEVEKKDGRDGIEGGVAATCP